MSKRNDRLLHALLKRAEAKAPQVPGDVTPDTAEYRRYVKGTITLSGPVEVKSLQALIEHHVESADTDSQRERKRFQWEKAGVLVAGLLALLTLVQAFFTHQTVVQQREEFILDRRPYIRVTVPCIKTYALSTKEIPCPPIEIGKPIAAVVESKNIGKSPALMFRITRWVNFGQGSEREYKLPRPLPESLYPIVALPDETNDTVAVSRTIFSGFQGVSVADSDTKPWDGSYPIAVFGNVYFKDTAGRDYCDPYLFLMMKSGAILVATEDLDPNCKDPDIR